MKQTKQTINDYFPDGMNTKSELDVTVEVTKGDEDTCFVLLGDYRLDSREFMELAKLVEFLAP